MVVKWRFDQIYTNKKWPKGSKANSLLKKRQKPMRNRCFEGEFFAGDGVYKGKQIGMQAGAPEGIHL